MGVVIGLVAPVFSAQNFDAPVVEDPNAPELVGVPPTSEKSSEEALLHLLLRAEHLLKLGHPDVSATMLRGLSVDGIHAPRLLLLQSWSLHQISAHDELAEVLEGEDDLTAELTFLRGTARNRSGRPGAIADLRKLWWGDPASIWGLQSLRELALHKASLGGVYPDEHREAIRAVIPAAEMTAPLTAPTRVESWLESLSNHHRDGGLLAAELHHAWGQRMLRGEEFTRAISALRRALSKESPPDLQLAIQLSLGDAYRRRGGYSSAMSLYREVARSGHDEFSERALANAGQMAIEFRKYEEAKGHFEAALVKNPVGNARHNALWGLGWVAFRTGDFVQARRFFAALRLEAPYGPLAPRALYWSARCLVERRDENGARAEMEDLVRDFPVDYYAYRASEWLGRDAFGDARYPAEPTPQHPRVAAVDSFHSTGMTIRTRRALKSALASANALGPHELLRLESVATDVGAAQVARRLRFERQRRFPLGAEARSALRQLYPPRFARLLEKHASRERVDPNLLVSVARQESGFNPRAVSPVGAIGLLQLMPATAASLLGEEDQTLRATDTLMEPELNARLGALYLGRMLRAFRGRAEYALAAYNAGPGAVTRWRQSHGDLPADIFVEEIPYRETRHYVRRVLAAARTFGYATSDAPLDSLPASYDNVLAAKVTP